MYLTVQFFAVLCCTEFCCTALYYMFYTVLCTVFYVLYSKLQQNEANDRYEASIKLSDVVMGVVICIVICYNGVLKLP